MSSLLISVNVWCIEKGKLSAALSFHVLLHAWRGMCFRLHRCNRNVYVTGNRCLVLRIFVLQVKIFEIAFSNMNRTSQLMYLHRELWDNKLISLLVLFHCASLICKDQSIWNASCKILLDIIDQNSGPQQDGVALLALHLHVMPHHYQPLHQELSPHP